MADAHLPPKKGYFQTPKKNYARHNGDNKEEEEQSRKRKMSEDEEETSNTKRSRVEKEEKEEDRIFSDSSSVDFDSSQEDDDDDDDDDDVGNEYGDGFGDDLMGDMDDRKRLWALTEVEREAILEERRMKREAFMENRRLRRELARAEQDKKIEKSRSRLKKVSRDESSGEEMDDDDDDDYALSDENEDEMAEKRRKKPSSPEFLEDEEDVIPLTPEDVNRIRLTRKNLKGWLDEPYFDKVVTGCYVRYCIGTNTNTGKATYRMMKILGVGKPYKRIYRVDSAPPILQTDKTLRLEMSGTEKDMRLDKVSNHRITQKELDFWRSNELDIGNRIPKRDDILAAYVVFSPIISLFFSWFRLRE